MLRISFQSIIASIIIIAIAILHDTLPDGLIYPIGICLVIIADIILTDIDKHRKDTTK